MAGTRKNLERAIKACAGERIVDFEEAVHSVLADKILVAIERRKPDVAAKMFEEKKK